MKLSYIFKNLKVKLLSIIETSLSEKVSKTGDTMTGNLLLEKATGDVGVTATRTDTGKSITLLVGSGGTNRGVWDNTIDEWLIYADSNNKTHIKDVEDYIVEDGISGDWYYQKWNSGVALCWLYNGYTYTAPATTAWGGMYSQAYFHLDYPANLFNHNPYPVIQKYGGTNGLLRIGGSGSATRTPDLAGLYSSSSSSSNSLYIQAFVIGQWKNL